MTHCYLSVWLADSFPRRGERGIYCMHVHCFLFFSHLCLFSRIFLWISQMGETCPNDHHHNTYSEHQTKKVLTLLMQRVWLDHSTRSMASHLDWLRQRAQLQSWLPVKELLAFVMPHGLPKFFMQSVFDFFLSIRRKKGNLYCRASDQVCLRKSVWYTGFRFNSIHFIHDFTSASIC